jgi:hypothetical protein
VDLTRRSFLAGLGSVSVGLLFRRKLDAVLASLERDLVAEQQVPDQSPSAAEIVVMPAATFYPERLVVPLPIAPLFIIEDIWIGPVAQLASSAGAFSSAPRSMDLSLTAVSPGTVIRFRVRYIGSDPRGARFQAAMIGTGTRGEINPRQLVLPIDSGVAIVS